MSSWDYIELVRRANAAEQRWADAVTRADALAVLVDGLKGMLREVLDDDMVVKELPTMLRKRIRAELGLTPAKRDA